MDSFPPGYEVNSATWLYHSLVLIVAVFFRFNRVWSLRNLDLALLLAASPGLLLVENPATQGWGYSWLFAVTGLFLVRLLADPLLRRRPHLGQNLNSQGSAFLCIAAFVLLATQAIRHDAKPTIAAARTASSNAESTEANPSDLTTAQPVVADAVTDGTAGEPGTGTEQDAAAVVAARTDSGPVVPIIHAPFGVIFELEENSARAIAVFAHLMVVLGLLFVGRNLFGDYQLGLAMGTLYLLLPCTAYDVGEVNHVLPAALTVWALVAYRRPMVSGILLGVACGIMFFPVFLLPLWAAYYGRRGALRFGTALLLVASVVATITALTTSSPDAFFRSTLGTIHLDEMFNFKSLGANGFWTSELNYYRIPVVVSFFLLLVGLTIWPRRKQLEHLTAFSAAIVVATQFWYPVQGGVYLLWYLPLLLVVVFRPRLVHLQPYVSTQEAEQAGKAPSISGPHSRSTTSADRLHLFR
jgi:hypothetical protein